MQNDCRLPRNCAVLIAFAACAVLFASCDNMDWPSYTVAFNSNGGTGTVPSQTVDARSSITIPDGEGLSRDGYVFMGWNTNAAGTGTDFYEDDTFTPIGNTTLFARWVSAGEVIVLTFDANSGSGTPPAPQIIMEVGSSITIPSGDGLSRDGHIFLGWNENADGTGANFNEGDTFIPTGNITLYARWEMGVRVPGGTLADQLAWLRTNAESGGRYIVELNDNETIAPEQTGWNPIPTLPTGRTNLTITLRGIGAMRTINLSASGNLFTVGSGVTLVLDNNVTLMGRGPDAVPPTVSNNNHLVRVDSGGTLVMNDGARITRNTNTETWTTANFGGGVRVNSGGTFEMRGGEISGNSADGSSTGGGVHVAGGGTFRISDGIIHGDDAAAGLGNTATGSGSGAALFNAGIAQRGTFTNGTFISLGVLSTTNDTIEVEDGILQFPPMEGTLAEQLAWLRNFAQSGSSYIIEISGNETIAPEQTGWNPIPTLPTGRTNLTITLRGIGAMRTINLSASGNLFTVGSGVTLVLDDNITLMGRNLAAHGANNGNHLVRINSGGTLVMNDGARITGNTNTNGWSSIDLGGGVRVNSGGTFEMRGGEISGNSARGWDTSGGVHVAGGGTFRISDGVIHGNDAEEGLRNTATDSGNGEALFNAGIAQRGTFGNGTFTWLGYLSTTNDTIRLVNGHGQPTGVTVSPSSASVARGGTQNFIAVVLGTNNPPQTVTWTIGEAGRHAQTTISANGVLMVADDESLTTLTVHATSTVDDTIYGEASVAVLIPTVTGVRVNPSSASVARGGTRGFTAEVLGIDPPQTVTWTIDEAGRHAQTTINANGVLTMADDESLTTLTVRATSTFDTSVSGTATVILDDSVIVPGTNLANRLDWVRDNAQDGGRYLIEISGHEVLGPHVLPTGRNLTITLRGIGAMRTVNLTASGSLFVVGSGVTLVLDNNVTLEGRNSAVHGFNNNNHLIRVNDGGTLVMNAGSRLTGNTNINSGSAYLGGGVHVNSGGVFYMHGGEISGNSSNWGTTSGGVHVASGGTFRMSGGVIYGNELEVPAGLRNTAPNGWAALFNAGIAQHGTFSLVGGFVSQGLLSSTNNTIRF